MASTLPRMSAEMPAFSLPVFAGLNPWVAADLSDFLALDPTIPESFRKQYLDAKAYFDNPVKFARQQLAKKAANAQAVEVTPEILASITDDQINYWIANNAAPQPPRAVILGRTLDFTGGTSGSGNSVAANGGIKTQPLILQGGRNVVVLGVRATAIVNSGTTSINLDLVDYEDKDANQYTWQSSTPLTNVAGTGPQPGLIYPQRWYGQLSHNIKLTNNFSSIADVRLNYICAALYMPGGA